MLEPCDPIPARPLTAGVTAERAATDGADRADRADRRTFLKQAGIVGAGVAGATWAAPSILALDKAFALPGSCCTQKTVNLAAAPFATGGGSGPGTYNLATQGLATSLTIATTQAPANNITNTPCAPATYTTGVITTCEQGGDPNGQIALCAIGTNKADIVITLTFSTVVRNLSFVLTDIDSSGPDANVEYQEQVTVGWTNSTGSSAPVYTFDSAFLTKVTTNVYKVISTNQNAANTATTNNLGVDFQCGGSIKTVTITSTNLNATPGTSTVFGRYVGIGQIKFCL